MNEPETAEPAGRVLLIACGALAHEIVALRRGGPWEHVDIQCLDAELHNRPERIAPAVDALLRERRDRYARVFVAYADCGSGGLLDRVLEEHNVQRLPGAHCYEFYAGRERFAELAAAEPGTFYLTDFLVRHFDRLVREGLGLERHPELRDVYFANYRRVVYLAQTEDEELSAAAREQARFLGLDFAREYTGLAPFARAFPEEILRWRN